MGIVEFFILVIVTVFAGAGTVWIIGYFAPTHPLLIDRIVWGVVIIIIVAALVIATGLLGHDPQIPRLR